MINYKLLLWYSVYYAGDGLDYSSVYWTSLVCLSGDKHFQQGTGCLVPDLWPCPLPRRRWSFICQLWLSRFLPPCSEHSDLRLATSLSGCFSANLWHQVLNWNLLASETVAENLDISADLHGQSGLQGGAAAVPSQLVCTILYSPSPCVSPPLSSIAMEKPCWCMYLTSVQMHLFEKENETLTYLE